MSRKRITINRGLDIPITGSAEAGAAVAQPVQTVALLGSDYRGLKPQLLVEVGEAVQPGQVLFRDKRNPGVEFTAPAGGTVLEVNRGRRRVLRSLVIRVDEDAAPMEFDRADPSTVVREDLIDLLCRSGLWTALRARPFGKVPAPDGAASALFITAMDSNPLAAGMDWLLRDRAADFTRGAHALAKLTDGPLFVCCRPGAEIPAGVSGFAQIVDFAGPHPAGLPGTHVHFLHPVGAARSAWHIGQQDVIAIGHLLGTGYIDPQRVITLAGPMARRPRQLRTRIGASVRELIAGEVRDGPCRVLGGSVLNAHRAVGALAYLGRYQSQVTLLAENEERRFLSFLRPGLDQYSATRAFASSLKRRPFPFTTSLNGSRRAMVPIGNLESVMPLDILPAPLLKALIVRDTDTARALGCLELEEEDLALCSFVCPSKYDYGVHLRDTLELIDKEG